MIKIKNFVCFKGAIPQEAYLITPNEISPMITFDAVTKKAKSLTMPVNISFLPDITESFTQITVTVETPEGSVEGITSAFDKSSFEKLLLGVYADNSPEFISD